MTAASRIRITADPGSFRDKIRPQHSRRQSAGFPRIYREDSGMRDKTNLNDAVVTGTAKIHGRRTVLVVMDNRFMMGSMGMAVGKKSPAPLNMPRKLPVIVISLHFGRVPGCRKA